MRRVATKMYSRARQDALHGQPVQAGPDERARSEHAIGSSVQLSKNSKHAHVREEWGEQMAHHFLKGYLLPSLLIAIFVATLIYVFHALWSA